MKILLTNDDGYNAPGILALYETLKADHEVMLVAPDREKSAVSHGITLNKPMRVDKVTLSNGGKGYSITGTPADCVKLGLFKFYASPPDLVVSGINPGSNTGVNVNYSGTIGAAREASLNGILGIAVSMFKKGNVLDFFGMSQFIAQIVNKIHLWSLPSGTLLNINAPGIAIDKIQGVKITRQASYNLSKQFEKRIDPRNKSYYWYGSAGSIKGEGNTDVNALLENYISITPIQCDMTDYKTLTKLESFQLL
ncbi:MAG: 5'/3'-nucleotidase SurE [Desulfobacula sp.]|nr:5'/3'-nucleotidase SurE [Desulfobacula sp.]